MINEKIIEINFLKRKKNPASSADPEDVLRRANTVIQKKFEFFETTLQIERFQQDMDDCKQCIAPLK